MKPIYKDNLKSLTFSILYLFLFYRGLDLYRRADWRVYCNDIYGRCFQCFISVNNGKKEGMDLIIIRNGFDNLFASVISDNYSYHVLFNARFDLELRKKLEIYDC